MARIVAAGTGTPAIDAKRDPKNLRMIANLRSGWLSIELTVFIISKNLTGFMVNDIEFALASAKT